TVTGKTRHDPLERSIQRIGDRANQLHKIVSFACGEQCKYQADRQQAVYQKENVVYYLRKPGNSTAALDLAVAFLDLRDRTASHVVRHLFDLFLVTAHSRIGRNLRRYLRFDVRFYGLVIRRAL